MRALVAVQRHLPVHRRVDVADAREHAGLLDDDAPDRRVLVEVGVRRRLLALRGVEVEAVDRRVLGAGVAERLRGLTGGGIGLALDRAGAEVVGLSRLADPGRVAGGARGRGQDRGGGDQDADGQGSPQAGVDGRHDLLLFRTPGRDSRRSREATRSGAAGRRGEVMAPGGQYSGGVEPERTGGPEWKAASPRPELRTRPPTTPTAATASSSTRTPTREPSSTRSRGGSCAARSSGSRRAARRRSRRPTTSAPSTATSSASRPPRRPSRRC